MAKKPEPLNREVREFDKPVKGDKAERELDGLDRIIFEMRERLHLGHDYWRETYDQSRDDVGFVYGDQWGPDDAAHRAENNRPMLTLNTLGQFIHLVSGESRKSRFSINVRQHSGPNDTRPAIGGGQRMLSNAEVMRGVIRDIEGRSDAGRQYARALQHAAEGGFGWLRLRTIRPQDDPFEMELRVEHIRDRWSVIIDPMCEQFNMSDAEWAVVHTNVPSDEFRARYPEASMAGGVYTGTTGFTDSPGNRDWWYGDGRMRVCEYFYREPMKRTALKIAGGEFDKPIVAWKDEIEDVLDDMLNNGYVLDDETEVESWKVMVCVCSATEILEGPYEWPDFEIPIIPVIGRQADIDGKHGWFGLTRFGRDAQVLLNYWATSATERVGDAPTSPWLATDEQIAGQHLKDWQESNFRRPSVMLYTHQPDQPPPSRQAPATMPVAELQLVNSAKLMVSETIGIHPASLGQPSNETSGAAIARRQAPGNTSLYEFIDNLASAVQCVGTRMTRIIPKVYSGPRLLQITLEDETQAMVDVNREIIDQQTGRKFLVGNLSLGRYSCVVRPGPQFDTIRQEFVELMTEWGRTDPEGFQAVRHMVMKMLDVPFADELARIFKSLAPRQVLSPQDLQEMPEPEPTPEQQLGQMQAQAMQMQAQADIQKAQASMQTTQMDVQINQLRTQMAQLKLETEQVASKLKIIEAGGSEEQAPDIDSMVKDSVADAMANVKT